MNAQSKVTISSPDSLPFIAVWNNVQLNQVPSFSITFREDMVGKVPVQLSFPSHPNLLVNQSVILKDQIATTFELDIVKGAHKLVPAAESSYTFSTINTPNQVPMNMESVVIDTLMLKAQANDQSDYEALKTQIASQSFESRKLENIQTYLQTHTISIEQLRYLMAQLSLEDRKLELLRTALPFVSEKSRLNEILEEFLLDKNKSKAKEMINQ